MEDEKDNVALEINGAKETDDLKAQELKKVFETTEAPEALKESDDDELDLDEIYKLVMPEQTVEELGQSLNIENEKLGKNEFVRQLETEEASYVSRLKRMIDAHTYQTLFVASALKNILNKSMIGDSYECPPNPDIPDDKGFSLKNKVMKVPASLNGAEVSGFQARMLILAANRNVKKIYLYNSGFNIVLKGPTLGEINLIYNRLNDKMGEYGRMMGAIFYMYSDLVIKDLLWEFVESLVIGSNLKKWDTSNRLRDNVSLLDYQTVILNVGTLMYKTGYEFIHVCTNPKCMHHTTETIDLNLLQLTDFSRISDEQLRKMASNSQVGPIELQEYKKLLNPNSSIDVGGYRIYQKVPSMSEYLEHGKSYNERLSMSIHDIVDPNIIDQYLKYNYSGLFEPWISQIDRIDEETGNVSFTIYDKETIAFTLTELQNSGERDVFTEKMNDFIKNAAVTNIGYLATPCDACKKVPSGTVNGFVPFDAQNSFFSMLVMRLIQTS